MTERGHKPGFKAGAVAIVVLAVISFFAFTGYNPFANPYRLHAVVADSLSLRVRGPVRIAGVDVGQIASVARYKDTKAAVVTMKIDRSALPIFRDARLAIRPRMFFEGDYFLDLQPGTPGAGHMPDGGTIPLIRTTGPVRFEDLLDTFPADARASLQGLVHGYGAALSGRPGPGEDATQDPAVRGLTAAQAIHRSLLYAPRALRGVAVVSDALLGRDANDLSRLVSGQQRVSAALVRDEQGLKDLVTDFNRTVAALAGEQGNLRTTVARLPGTLAAAQTALAALDRAFPETRALAREVLPGVNQLGPTIDAAFPWAAQARALVSPAELQGLLRDLRPATTDLAAVQHEALTLVPQVDLVARCAYRNFLPTGEKAVDDGPLSTGLPNYKEFWQALVGFAGESQNFDGNGSYTRFEVGGGSYPVVTPRTTTGQPPLYGNASAPPLGSRPARPAAKPPQRRGTACYRNALPNLTARTGGAP